MFTAVSLFSIHLIDTHAPGHAACIFGVLHGEIKAR
jgi:hypothetical protein